MRQSVMVILICLASSVVLADEEARRAQINAATTDAFDALRRRVLATHLAPDVTVERFLDRYEARGQFNSLLQTAQQIGGTRWLDDQTVQVRLEMDGGPIANLIEAIALTHPRNLPMPLHYLIDRLKRDIAHRTFAATGTSMTGSAAARLRPSPTQVAWRAVSDKDCRAAIEAARRNAMDHVLESLRLVEWDVNRHLADALAVPAVKASLEEWLAARPITSIEFRDDLEIRISLAAAPQDLWPTLQADILKQAAVSPPHTAREWEQLRQQVMTRMAPAVGRAVAPAADAVAGPPALAIPHDPPAWTQGPPVQATGVSSSVAGSKLRTARAAEAIAMEEIRSRLNAMAFDPTITVGQAAQKDPHIEAAITRSLRQARISKVEYDAPQAGAVRVMMQLDPGAVWREIAGR